MIPLFSRQTLAKRLQQRKQSGYWRLRKCLTPIHDAPLQVTVDNRLCISFCSNDYLNLSQHPGVKAAAIEAIQHYGVGGQSSPLIAGYTDAQATLEQEFCHVLGFDKAMLFSSGYVANLAVIMTLADSETILFMDKYNHASIIDAGLQAKLQMKSSLKRYSHLDYDNLALLLQEYPKQKKLIISDSVFSMDGDSCDAKRLSQLAAEHQATLILDDAHGFGVIGDSGLGILQQSALTADDVDVLVIPMGKALGSGGAIVLMNNEIFQAMSQFARPYIYSTSIAPALCVGASESLRLIQDATLTRQLKNNIKIFREKALEKALPLIDSHTAIQGVLINDAKACQAASDALLDKGFFVRAICPPTVPENGTRLRISITAAHTEDQINKLVESIYIDLTS